jgi:D-amino-acid dehydrogenase
MGGLTSDDAKYVACVKQGKHARVFYNTGHGHLGWTLSAATAVLISEEIAQKFPS